MNLDRAWCASPTHKADCDRQITPEVQAAMDKCNKPHYSMAYFCGWPDKEKENMTKDLKAGFEDMVKTAAQTRKELGFLPEVLYLQLEKANGWLNGFQAGAKHILELVESEGMRDMMVEAIYSGTDGEITDSRATKAAQKAIADEIRKGMA